MLSKMGEELLAKWSSDWEPPSWTVFAWREVTEEHRAY